MLSWLSPANTIPSHEDCGPYVLDEVLMNLGYLDIVALSCDIYQVRNLLRFVVTSHGNVSCDLKYSMATCIDHMRSVLGHESSSNTYCVAIISNYWYRG